MTKTRLRHGWMAFVCVATLSIGAAREAGAAPIVFDTFGPGDAFAISGPYGVDGPGFQAFHFVAAATGALERITVALGRTGAAQTTTLFDLHTGPSTDALGELLESFVVANTVTPDDTPPFTGAAVTMLSVVMPTLTAGEGYWLSFGEPGAANGERSAWFGNSVGAVGPRLTSLLPSMNAALPAFRVEATSVPEPTTALLLLSGLIAVARARRALQ